MSVERIETVVVGGGQAGLATGRQLSRRGRPYLILEADERIGDVWRRRYDSLRLFTPARYDALPGRRFPAPGWSFPTGREFADYLGDYAVHFGLSVRTGAAVRRWSLVNDRHLVETVNGTYEAANVVVATGNYQVPRVPDFAPALDPDIRQLHSAGYHRPEQVGPGDVLVVGAGNTGADLALELASTHRVLLAGRHPGQLPWRIDGPLTRVFCPPLFFGFRHLLKVSTPPGRRLKAHMHAHSGPLIRVRPADLDAAGVVRMPRVTGVRDGLPLFADGSTARVPTVLWCTGYRADTGWIDHPAFAGGAEPAHRRGVAARHAGVYLVGRTFQYAAASSMVQGVGRDAAHVAGHIARRADRQVGRTATSVWVPNR